MHLRFDYMMRITIASTIAICYALITSPALAATWVTAYKEMYTAKSGFHKGKMEILFVDIVSIRQHNGIHYFNSKREYYNTNRAGVRQFDFKAESGDKAADCNKQELSFNLQNEGTWVKKFRGEWWSDRELTRGWRGNPSPENSMTIGAIRALYGYESYAEAFAARDQKYERVYKLVCGY